MILMVGNVECSILGFNSYLGLKVKTSLHLQDQF